jgi:hypothetical protein
MATLTGQFISQSYGGVIQLSTNTGIVTGSNTQLQDGFGTNLGVWFNGQGNISGSAITSSGDSLISGMTIGRGGGNASTNVAIGPLVLANNTTAGIQNTAVGNQALYLNTAGDNNVAIGYVALQNNTSGSQNVAVGRFALNSNTTGSNNTAVGDRALIVSVASNNTAIGKDALLLNTTGDENTAVGYQALDSNTTGVQNTALGNIALANNSTGNSNVAIGRASLYTNAIGIRNTAVGEGAYYFNVSGSENVSIGYVSLFNLTNGNYNTTVGAYSGQTLKSGSYNTLIGWATDVATGSFNTIIGASVALTGTTNNNIILADGAGNIRARYSGSWTLDGVVNTTASFALNATSASFAVSASWAPFTPTPTGSFATTGSNTFVGNQTISGSVSNAVRVLTIGSTTASIDLSTGNLFTLTLVNGVNTHISASNIQLGQTAQLQITQPAGVGTVTFSSAFSFPSGSTYTAFASASAVDVLSFTSFNGTKLRTVAQNNFS